MFSKDRFIQTVKWDIISSKRIIIRNAVGIFLLALGAALSISGCLWGNRVEESSSTSIASVFMSVTIVGMAIFGARICFNMHTKTELINYLMLPATKLEKFLANMTVQTVVALISAIVALIAADFCQMLFSVVLSENHEFYSYSLKIAGIIGEVIGYVFYSTDNFIGSCLIVSGYAIGHSVYVFGGTFFRKNPIICTMLTLAALSMITSSFVALAGVTIYNWLSNIEFDYVVTIEWLLEDKATLIIFGCIVTLIELAIAGFFYTMAYRKFCKIQVINNKFFN